MRPPSRALPRRRARLALALALALLAAAAALCATTTTPAHAEEPWWGIEVGARPTNLWAPADESQQLTGATSGTTVVKVGDTTVGCFASSVFACLLDPPYKGALGLASLQAALEAPAAYGPGGVEVSEPQAGVFEVGSVGPMAGRWVAPLKATGTGAGAKVLQEGGSGRLILTVTNLGDAPAEGAAEPILIADRLPEGVAAYGVEGFAGFHGQSGPVECSLPTSEEVSCAFEGELPVFEAIEVEVFASLIPPGGAPGQVSVSGGGATPKSAVQALRVSPEATRFGIQSFAMGAEEEGGAVAGQAGSHPFQLTTSLQLNAGRVRPDPAVTRGLVEQPAPPRNFRFPLPLGLVGNPSGVPECSLERFTALTAEQTNQCPPESAVGVASVTVIEAGTLKFARLAVPIFNLVPAYGEPARFGFAAAGVPVTIDASLDAEDEYRITAFSDNVSELATVLATTATFWGDPGDPAHDSARGWSCVFHAHPGVCERPPAVTEQAFLRLPVSCAEPLDFRFELEPWNTPPGSLIERALSPGSTLRGCSKVPSDPRVDAAPTSKLAESASGLGFRMSLPDPGLANPNPEARAEAQPERLEVALPEGVTANPSAAEGLATCSEAQFEAEKLGSGPGEGCPQASKLGNVLGHSPLIEGAIEGSLYLAEPYRNPEKSLIALYLVARLPERGVFVKQAGKVEPDPETGQLVSTFDRLPQLPYSDFELHFREGARAPLVTPPRCGTYTTVAKFLPYSAADLEHPTPDELVERTSPFTIERGVDGGGCPQGADPFGPGFEAGSLDNAAGRYSPFYMRLTRRDGDQDLTKFSAKLPPGVVGRLAGTGECPDADIARARSRTGEHGGVEERDNPSCPADSQIGRVLAGAGVGSVLTYVPGRLYLAGPYEGAPLSVVAIVPAVAGPFDAGTVVTREALRIDPLTAEVLADGSASDPIPHILKGIPLKVRDIRVYVDKPDFTLNPTSCAPSATEATLWSGGSNVFSSLDDVPHSLSSRFQAADCAALGFRPRLRLRLRGGVRRGGHPALRGVFTPRPGDANLRRLVLRLPHSAFLDQAHIRTICTRVQFAAGGGNGEKCPGGAVYGHARAWTPLLSEPLEGPVFLRSSSHNLPDLVAALHGLIDVEAVARIDSSHGGIRTTFATVPDAPLSRVIVDMRGGKKGLIVNSRGLCHKPGRNRAVARYLAHNGRRASARPLLRASGCAKAKTRKKRHTRHRRGR